MEQKPFISVIIPTYNRSGFLREAIDSVLAQDYDSFELIVVDDGSTDSTKEILDSYMDDIIVLHQENKGVSAARNRGIKDSSGELIAFLDSDDLWLPGKLSIQADFFESNPDIMICQTEEIWIRKGIRVNPKKKHKKHSGMIFMESLALCLISPSAVMVRKDLFNKVGMFDETLPACEDYDLWLRVSCRYPAGLIETPLIMKKGGHEDQLSAAPGLDKFRIQSLKNIIDSDILNKDYYTAAVKTLKGKCTIYASGCKKRGRTDEAEYYLDLGEKYQIKTR
ncbi:MAG: glycosyltransferase [Desulfobacterales bacterium]|jgi:glycosyltransferase involved in cell wall biosynthesis|nr:glycosyltransferase [Desulfobacteraceae bacterium]MBT7086617.1 glycosyltransferase [Desulfobacterales bacterium]MBT7697538.1 glycosyltransferase [Desulfobacterales bacterium]